MRSGSDDAVRAGQWLNASLEMCGSVESEGGSDERLGECDTTVVSGVHG